MRTRSLKRSRKMDRNARRERRMRGFLISQISMSRVIIGILMMIRRNRLWLQIILNIWKKKAHLEKILLISWLKIQLLLIWKPNSPKKNGSKKSNKDTWSPLKLGNLTPTRYVRPTNFVILIGYVGWGMTVLGTCAKWLTSAANPKSSSSKTPEALSLASSWKNKFNTASVSNFAQDP